MSKFSFILFFLFLSQIGFSQVVVEATPDSLSSSSYFDVEKEFFSKEELEGHLASQIDSLRNAGYLASSVDSIKVKQDSVFLHLFLGNRVEQLAIENGNIDSLIYNRYVKATTIDWVNFNQIKKQVVDEYLEQGYINSKVFLDDIDLSPSQVKGKLFVDRGEQYVLDSILIKGDVQISRNYLRLFFGIEEGDLITKDLLDELESRAQQASFFSFDKNPSFRLKEDGKADLYFYLEERKGNQFDLLLGFLPNPNPRLSDRNLLLTGEGNLRLLNPFGGGRELEIDYKQQQPESPLLNANVFLPIVFGQRFGARASFDLEKQDSSFVNVFYSIGANYQFDGNKHITASFQSTTSFLQDVDTVQVKQTRFLPPSSDYTQQLYSLAWRSSSLNSLIAPTNGLSICAKFGAGNRKIEPSSEVVNLQDDNGFEFASLYDEINDDQLTILAESDVEYFIPIKSSSAIKLQNKSGYKYYNEYFENDLYRLGGFRSIRGFDERSLLTSLYSINSVEWRLLLNRESFFSVFSDIAYIENEREQTDDFLVGLGTGLDLSTRAGIFSINIAVGRDNENPFDFQRTRIHFGYVNVF